MTAIGFLSSCDSTENADEAPLITITPSGLGTDNEVSNATFSVTVKMDQNPTTTKKIDELLITSTGGVDTTISVNKATETLIFAFDAPAAGATETFTFRVQDNGSKSATKSLTVKGPSVVSPAGNIDTYSATLVGAQNNATTGSAFASSNGNVYLKAQAASNSNLIDFVFFVGATNAATIAAPNDPTVDGSTPSSVDLTDTYSTKNATKFMTTSISVSDFNAMSDDADFPAFTGSLTKVNNLSVGNVFAFETVAGKVGLVHVSALNGTASGDITLNVKVQE